MKKALLILSLGTIITSGAIAQDKIPASELAILNETCITGITEGKLTEEQKTNYCKCSTEEINNQISFSDYKISSGDIETMSSTEVSKKKEVNKKIMSIAFKCMEKHLK